MDENEEIHLSNRMPSCLNVADWKISTHITHSTHILISEGVTVKHAPHAEGVI